MRQAMPFRHDRHQYILVYRQGGQSVALLYGERARQPDIDLVTLEGIQLLLGGHLMQ